MWGTIVRSLAGTLIVMALGVATVFASGGDDPPTFEATADLSNSGRTIDIRARVRDADERKSFSASAVVSFTTGDRAVNLVRNGDNFDARKSVTAPSAEPKGTKKIVITIRYGMQTVVKTRWVELRAVSASPSPSASPSSSPTTSPRPTTSARPTASASASATAGN